MRLALLMLLLVAPGCVANHRIRLESEPSGVHVEMNGEYIGTTPMEYVLISPYAETIWPEEVSFVGRKSGKGWKPAVKRFEAKSQLPGRILFLLESEESTDQRGGSRTVGPQPRVDEYETLEEQKRRLNSF